MISPAMGAPLAEEEHLPMTTAEVSDEDFQEILAQTRHFVRTAVVPREQEILADDRVPDDLREQAKKMGLFGYAIPQEWGGLGLNLAQDVELAMELGYTSLALRSMFGTNNGIAGQVLVGFGTDEQKARWLEPMASGDVVASFALTEPGAGSNPSGLRTKAVRDGADWIISGQKRFITNAPVATASPDDHAVSPNLGGRTRGHRRRGVLAGQRRIEKCYGCGDFDRPGYDAVLSLSAPRRRSA
jgi:alkylation response protein AidB-like acyl-CoA dehydrogenase